MPKPVTCGFQIEQARLVASNVKGLVVPGSGHWLMEEAPQAVIPAIIEFINWLERYEGTYC